MTGIKIPYSQFKPSGNALDYVSRCIDTGRVQGDGPFSKKCESMLGELTGSGSVVLTSSGTDALEMAALLAGISAGDEVIMPSFTFVSSANSIVLRGAIPVFVDIDPRTLNISPEAIRAALSPRTRAIMPVHYAGVACDMTSILEIAAAHNLKIIEDAAHGVGAYWDGRHLGSIGHFGALSFHETKNISAGEGGALLVNSANDRERAEIVRDKGTNRKKFIRGEVDRYTWVDLGSSFLPSELQAALLASQLEQMAEINGKRRRIWDNYHDGLRDLEADGLLQRPYIPDGVAHNGHIYWILLKDGGRREALRRHLAHHGIQATSHYECLHLAPVASRFARFSSSSLPVTENVARSILRLPLYPHMTSEDQTVVIDTIRNFFAHSGS